MKNIFLAAFLLIFGFSVNAQSASEKAVLELSKKKFQWMIAMNFDSLEKVLDERLLFIHSNGWPETKQEFIDDIKSGKLRYSAIEVIEASARVYEKSAVITGRGKFTVTLEGKDMTLELKYSEFYISKNGKWLLASRHANRMP